MHEDKKKMKMLKALNFIPSLNILDLKARNDQINKASATMRPEHFASFILSKCQKYVLKVWFIFDFMDLSKITKRQQQADNNL